MLPISVLTATYNHPQELEKLYESLIKQDDKNFSWIIVNDGSRQETKELIDRFVKEGIIDVIAYHQENGGKSRAINRGIDFIKDGTEFFVIVDDDEKLYSDAVTNIKRYYFKYKDAGCGVIHFNRKDEKGNIIAEPYFNRDYFMSFQTHKGRRLHADGYLGYYTKDLGNFRFKIFEGEKYIAPSTLFMKVTSKTRLLWASVVLGETEYLAGGITKQGRKLRIKNPQGMIEYCNLMQENGANLKTRIAYSTQGYAYSSFYQGKADTSKLIKIMFMPGKILGIIWKRKYNNH